MDQNAPREKKKTKEGEGKQIQKVRTEKSAGDQRVLQGAELYEEKLDQCINQVNLTSPCLDFECRVQVTLMEQQMTGSRYRAPGTCLT